MSNRALRRAAERLTLKSAAKQPTQVMTAAAGAAAPASPNIGVAEEINDSTIEAPPTRRPLSDAQLAANRANAQKSAGPVSLQGRATSSLNAVKTGLTGQTVLLSTDDAIAYRAHLDRHFTRHAPANDQEHTLVQMAADTEWRLLRIPSLEAGIYAVARLKLADLHPQENDPAIREALITGEIQLLYRRDLSNLALQERRLRNHLKSDLAQLEALQTERLEKKNEKGKIQARMFEAIRLMFSARKTFGTFDPAGFGFEFSLSEIEYCHEALESAHRRGDAVPSVADMLSNLRNQ